MEEEVQISKKEVKISEENFGQLTIENAKLRTQIDLTKSRRPNYSDFLEEGGKRLSLLLRRKLKFEILKLSEILLPMTKIIITT